MRTNRGAVMTWGLPSISFQAFKKSSGSEKATKPYFACEGSSVFGPEKRQKLSYLPTKPVADDTSLGEGGVLDKRVR